MACATSMMPEPVGSPVDGTQNHTLSKQKAGPDTKGPAPPRTPKPSSDTRAQLRRPRGKTAPLPRSCSGNLCAAHPTRKTVAPLGSDVDIRQELWCTRKVVKGPDVTEPHLGGCLWTSHPVSHEAARGLAETRVQVRGLAHTSQARPLSTACLRAVAVDRLPAGRLAGKPRARLVVSSGLSFP